MTADLTDDPAPDVRLLDVCAQADLPDLRTGQPGGPPATRAVATYPARTEGGRVVVQVPA